MNRENFINIMNNRSHLPNMSYLINEVNQMNPQNFETLSRYADNFFRMDNVANWEEETKTMMLIANAMNNGKDSAFIDGMSRAKSYEDAYCMYSIQNVQDSITSVSSNYFAQTDVNINSIPIQGWKFHISANSLADYSNLCTTVIPELQQLGVAFKMVRPEMFERQLASDQMGKAITIYPSPGFDINKLSPQAKAILLTDDPNHVNPIGDAKIQGRVYARYGRFKGSNTQEAYITTTDGKLEYDPKKFRNIAPMFMPRGILG